MSEHNFDVVVIGAGPAGEICAGRLADGGLSVAIVERDLVAGECSYYACMPSKALLRPGEALAEARRHPGSREAATGELDVAAALARRDEVIHDLDDSGQLPWLEDKGIELFRGEGRLDGELRVVVGDEVLIAGKAVVVATGSGAAIPPIDGLREASPWTNREITTAKQAPASLLILGGGVVGCEMAQAWTTLGSSVTLVEGSDRVLGKEEDFAAEQVAACLKEAGVDLRLGVKVVAAGREQGTAWLEFEGGERVEGDELLVAVGRKPHTDALGLETVGLQPGKSIEVGDSMAALGHDWLYAIGDCNGRALLTHAGKYQARVAACVILGEQASATHDGPGTPRVTFTEPQVAAVGHTVSSAREAGLAVRVVDVSTQGNAGASFHGRSAEGTSRLILDEQRGVIVGATFTGPDVGEMLHAASIAVAGEVPVERLWNAIPSFPTRSEVWLKLLEKFENEG